MWRRAEARFGYGTQRRFSWSFYNIGIRIDLIVYCERFENKLRLYLFAGKYLYLIKMESKYATIAIIFAEILIYFFTLKIENLPIYSSKTFTMNFQFLPILENKNIR